MSEADLAREQILVRRGFDAVVESLGRRVAAMQVAGDWNVLAALNGEPPTWTADDILALDNAARTKPGELRQQRRARERAEAKVNRRARRGVK